MGSLGSQPEHDRLAGCDRKVADLRRNNKVCWHGVSRCGSLFEARWK